MKKQIDLSPLFLLLIKACLQCDVPYEKAVELYYKFKELVNDEFLSEL